jgi:hypothetical protein
VSIILLAAINSKRAKAVDKAVESYHVAFAGRGLQHIASKLSSLQKLKKREGALP